MTVSDPFHWYAFVYVGDWLNGTGFPQVFFVPSEYVAKRLLGNQPDQQEWFWMKEKEAEQYCGLAGFKNLQKAITG